jgi:hypothetical protein
MISKMLKINLLKILFFIFIINPVFSEDFIELYIDGQKYIRDYPESLEEANGLIDALVEINNDLDKSFIEYQVKVREEENLFLQKLNALEESNKNLQDQFNDSKNELNKIAGYINQKSSLLLFGTIGPSFGLADNMVGQRISMGIAPKVKLFNLFPIYAGLIGNMTIYYQEVSKIKDIGFGLYLGIFLK